MIIDFVLDDWQKEVLSAEGNLCINSGRQVGKSQVIAIKTAEYIINHPKKHVVVISVTEDQAELILQKVLLYLADNAKSMIGKGKKKPTKHVVHLTNGSTLRSKAVGQYGIGIRGLTVDVLVADEAAYMPDAIWHAATPMLLTTGGQIWLLSTPNTQSGYFYEAFTDRDMGFQTFHVNSEQVASGRPEPMRSLMLKYLEREKARMSDLEYKQQYLAMFAEEQGQFFPDDLIISCQSLKRPESFVAGDYFLGVDVARMGGDESTFEVLKREGDVFFHTQNIAKQFTLTTDSINTILELDSLHDFMRIYIDDGGLGVAVFDQLLVTDQTKRKVVAINNASRSLTKDGKKKRRLLKEDLYYNMKRMMESGKLRLLDDEDVFLSLKSIVVEETERSGYVRIYGRYSHIAEGLIRAAWAVRNTHLNIWFEKL